MYLKNEIFHVVPEGQQEVNRGCISDTDFGRRRKSEYVEGNPSGLHPVIFPSQEVVFK